VSPGDREEVFVEDIDHTSPPAGRKVREVLSSLRRTYGSRAPSYYVFWTAVQEGKVRATRKSAYLLIHDDDETVAAALGLTRAPVAA
jgi:hypothetical protein